MGRPRSSMGSQVVRIRDQPFACDVIPEGRSALASMSTHLEHVSVRSESTKYLNGIHHSPS
jgi:hypothetical protein